MRFGRGGYQLRDILLPVPPGRKKIREDHDLCGSTLHAPLKSCCNVRLSEFHMSRFNDCVRPDLNVAFGGRQQHRVAFGSARTMIHNDDSGNLCSHDGDPGKFNSSFKTSSFPDGKSRLFREANGTQEKELVAGARS